MTKPSDIKFAEAPVMATKPSEVAKKRPSTPVRNPAFREHEGLRALQRELHQRPVPRKK